MPTEVMGAIIRTEMLIISIFFSLINYTQKMPEMQKKFFCFANKLYIKYIQSEILINI